MIKTFTAEDIPKDWRIAQFAEIADYSLGRTPPRKIERYWPKNDGIPWVAISDMRPFSIIKETSENVSYSAAKEIFQYPPVPKGTLLMSFKLSIGRTAILGIDAYHNEAIISIYPKKDVDKDYLRFYLPTIEFAQHQDRAVKGQTLNKGKINILPVTIPPLFEQKAIAGMLAKIQAAMEVQDKIVATLKELKAATMAKLFREGLRGERLKQTEIGEIPESWETVKIGEVARVGNGSTPKRTNPAYWEGGTLPWLTSAKVHEAIITKADEFVTDLAAKECHLPEVPKGSVVIAITGQGKTLGNAALVTFNTRISQHLAYLHFHNSNIWAEFVLTYLQSRYQDLRQASQSGGSTKGALTCRFLEQYSIPIPSLEEQREIANNLLSLDRQCDAEVKKRTELSALFSSMLHMLMTGKVRVTPRMIEYFQRDGEEKMKTMKKPLDEKILQEIIKRIVEAVAPEKIILFGSAARGEIGPDSDLDFLVIRECDNERKMAWEIRRSLLEIRPIVPIDIIVVKPEVLNRHKDTIGYIYRPALREGRVVYAA